MSLVTEETDGFVRTLGLNRPEKRNAFSVAMLEALSAAYDRAETDADVRAIVLYAHGPVFTAGLDLMDVFPRLGEGAALFAKAAMDPWGATSCARRRWRSQGAWPSRRRLACARPSRARASR
jgi:enoyl-CoA hydratase/carnithine racemase